jgi:hypothetical protein
MKSKVSAVIVLAVIFVALSVMSSVKFIHENAPRYSTVLLTDGGEQMCIPLTACGYKFAVVPDGSRFSATVLLKDGGARTTKLLVDGPGPMCPPTAGCGSADLGLAREEHIPPIILLADGTGPMCPPRTGCGYRDLGLGSEQRISPTILLADGTGPMCPPTTGCGLQKKDSVVKPSSV